MRLYVYVLEAKYLPPKDYYVKLKLGKFKSKTRTSRQTPNPVWNEEFVFRVHDADDELHLSLLVDHQNEPTGVLNGSIASMGYVKIPVWSVAAEENHALPPTWFSLETPKNGKLIANENCGKILLTVSLHGKGHDGVVNHKLYSHPNITIEDPEESECPLISSENIFCCKDPSYKVGEGKKIMKAIANRLEKIFNKNEEAPKQEDSSEFSCSVSDYEDCVEQEEHPSVCSFDEAIVIMESREDKQEMPKDLPGGILVDQFYVVSPSDLNMFLFAPNSQFVIDIMEQQCTTDVQDGPWTWKCGDTACLTRVVSYTKPGTKLVKFVKATEEQTYIRANKKEFAVLVHVSTPEVPYGNTFIVELLYKIMPGPELPSGEESSHLVVSWGVVFHRSTMMKAMIEGGIHQGLKESFDQFSNLLAQNLKMVDSIELSGKEQLLATLQTEHQSDWELAKEYFWNFSVVSTTFIVLYVAVHILLCRPSEIQGLEFEGLELPDSFGELITSAILVIQLERVFNMVLHFIQARLYRGSDHGVKAQGDGWILTVALVEGINLASLVSTGFSDPYVVVTCNGKTRSSSVKLQSCDPQWNEILEFDAMEEPPSVLDVEVFDFDGPFDQAASLGHAEVNFLKHTSTELADMWVPLEGKLAQSSQSKLHLRIFLENNKGVKTIKDYLSKMEKQVGKKLNLRSPQKNSTFQKLFGLPPEEFLINDFTCSLKRKLPLQGRLFLSARIVGFYANLFGHKTKFFFLWEDIEEIQVLPPSLVSVGSPILVIILRKDQGLDARHGAKSQDHEGRLRFHFQSFVSFNVASKTIMALWRARNPSSDHKTYITEEQEDQELMFLPEDLISNFDSEDAKMSKIYSAELPININSVMELFEGGKLECRIMEKSGCISYTTSTWEHITEKPEEGCERQLSYKFNRHITIFGGEVTSVQRKQKLPTANKEGWILNEVMTLHGVPFGDHFRVHLRYQIEKSLLGGCTCKIDTYIKIRWLKSCKFQDRINRNITEKFSHRLKEIFELVEREILFTTSTRQQDGFI